MSPGKLLGKPVDIVEVPVGLVGMLLVKLGSVECFVVESRYSRSCRFRTSEDVIRRLGECFASLRWQL